MLDVDQLHDELDHFEDTLERNAAEAEKVGSAKLKELMRQVLKPTAEQAGAPSVQDFVLAMTLTALEVEDKVNTDATTEAFVLGAEFGRRRVEGT